jgi:hypothetical protein
MTPVHWALGAAQDGRVVAGGSGVYITLCPVLPFLPLNDLPPSGVDQVTVILPGLC